MIYISLTHKKFLMLGWENARHDYAYHFKCVVGSSGIRRVLIASS